MPGPHFQLLINEKQVHQNDNQLYHPAGEGGDGRAHNAQLRQSEMAENQAVVQAHINENGADGHHRAHKRRLHTLQRIHQGVGDGIDYIRPAHDFQIFQRLSHHRLVRGEQPQNAPGKQQSQQEEDQTDQAAKFQPHRGNAPDGIHLALAPVLRPQHRNAGADAGYKGLEHKLDLVDQRGAGQCQLRIGAQHDVVYHIHHQCRQLLE